MLYENESTNISLEKINIVKYNDIKILEKRKENLKVLLNFFINYLEKYRKI